MRYTEGFNTGCFKRNVTISRVLHKTWFQIICLGGTKKTGGSRYSILGANGTLMFAFSAQRGGIAKLRLLFENIFFRDINKQKQSLMKKVQPHYAPSPITIPCSDFVSYCFFSPPWYAKTPNVIPLIIHHCITKVTQPHVTLVKALVEEVPLKALWR